MKMQFWTISLSLNDFHIKKIVLQRQWKYDDDVFGTRWWQRVKKNTHRERTEKRWQRLYLFSFLCRLMSLSQHYRILMMVSAAAATTAPMRINGIFKCHVKNRNTSQGFLDFLNRNGRMMSKWSILTESYFKLSWLHVCLVCVYVVPSVCMFFLHRDSKNVAFRDKGPGLFSLVLHDKCFNFLFSLPLCAKHMAD